MCSVPMDRRMVFGVDAAASRQLLVGQLGVRGGGRMDDQALHVGNVGQQREDLQMVDELLWLPSAPPLMSKVKMEARAVGEVAARTARGRPVVEAGWDG